MNDFQKLVAAVAKELGWYRDATYGAEDTAAAIFLLNPRGGFTPTQRAQGVVPKIHFLLNWQKTRIEISGGWPHGPHGAETPRHYSGETAPRITVAANREAAEVAREIRQRFLEPYLALHTTCVRRVREAEAYREGSLNNASRIAHAAGVPNARMRNHGDHNRLWFEGGGSTWHADVEVTGDSVGINIRALSVDEAIRVVALLNEMRRD